MLLSWLAAFLLPFWTNSNEEAVYLSYMFHEGDAILTSIPVLFMVSGMLSLGSLFSFKLRKRQIIFNRLNIVINFLLLGIIVYHLLMLPGETEVSEKGIGVFIPVMVIVFLAMANKAIIKDEKLVKSVDRLR